MQSKSNETKVDPIVAKLWIILHSFFFFAHVAFLKIFNLCLKQINSQTFYF